MVRRIVTRLADAWLKLRPIRRRGKSLIIVKLDHIGDYVLFRNFIEQVKKSQRFAGYEITLLGNIAWQDLSLKLDQNAVDHFFWVDRSKFVKSFKYRLNLLLSLESYDVLVNPTYSRVYDFDDHIASRIRATIKIASTPDHSNLTPAQEALGNKCYDQLISADDDIKFEFYRTRDFFEKLLQAPQQISRPQISLPIKRPDRQSIVVFPGGTYASKLWSADHYATLINLISKEWTVDVYICGGQADREVANDIASKVKAHDMVGKTTLTELTELINQSTLLISNETSAVHIANSLGKPYVCVADGVNIKRFSPYPGEIASGVHIFPKEIQDNIHEIDKLAHDYKRGALHQAKRNADINTIAPEVVFNAVRKLLKSL